MKIEIRSLFSGWQTVDRETAARFVSHLLRNMSAIPAALSRRRFDLVFHALWQCNRKPVEVFRIPFFIGVLLRLGCFFRLRGFLCFASV